MTRSVVLLVLAACSCATTSKEPPPPVASAFVVPAAPGAVGPRAAGKDPPPVQLGVPDESEDEIEPPDGAVPHPARPSSSGGVTL